MGETAEILNTKDLNTKELSGVILEIANEVASSMDVRISASALRRLSKAPLRFRFHRPYSIDEELLHETVSSIVKQAA